MNVPVVDDIREYVERVFPKWGRNKTQEIVRLLYEIAKKEQCDFTSIIRKSADQKIPRFIHLKADLASRRYPEASREGLLSAVVLPELDIDPQQRVNVTGARPVIPKRFFIEDAVRDSALVTRLHAQFPNAQYVPIKRYREYISIRDFSPVEYNRRFESVFIVREDADFFMPCPCTTACVCCGYQIMNTGVGCPFECAYCYLQGYVNAPGITIPANIEDYFAAFAAHPVVGRVGSGQFTDSLVFDHITGYSKHIVEFFRRYPNTQFEFKTKSANVGNLITIDAPANIVVSWSVNPQAVIDTAEFFTASLQERLLSALLCVRAGYRVGFHFDPIIFYDAWEEEYADIITNIFDMIDDEYISWISLGCLRMTLKTKQVIENRFPESAILDGELIPGFDGKLRYPRPVREMIYKRMVGLIRDRSATVPVYLCMEEPRMHEACNVPTEKGVI